MEGRLIINRDQEHGKSSLLALDARSGLTVWQTPRPESFTSYSTPVFWKHGAASEVVLAGSFCVVGYDLENGRERWSARGLEALCVCPTPVLGDDRLYAMSYSFAGSKMPSFAELATQMDTNGDHKISRDESRAFLVSSFEEIDKDKDGFVTEAEWNANVAMLNRGEHGIFALREPGTGDLTLTHLIWGHQRDRIARRFQSSGA